MWTNPRSIIKCQEECWWNEDLRFGIVQDWYLETEWTCYRRLSDMSLSWQIRRGDNKELVTWACRDCYVQYILFTKLKMGML